MPRGGEPGVVGWQPVVHVHGWPGDRARRGIRHERGTELGVCRIRIRLQDRLACNERLGRRRHDVNRNRSRRGQVHEILTHLGLQPGAVERAPDAIRDLHRALRTGDVRMLGDLFVDGADPLGRDAIQESLLDLRTAAPDAEWSRAVRDWLRAAACRAGRRGTTGRISRDGCCASCRIACAARRTAPSSPNTPPVLGLRSKRGKLLLEISSRMRWPARNRLRRRAEIDGDSVGCARRQRLRRRLAVAVARAEDAVAERSRRAVGKDVDQRAGEIGVACVETSPTASRRAGR